MKKLVLILLTLISCQTEEVLFNVETKVLPADSGQTNPNKVKVFLGEQILIQAIPNLGYSFHKWTMDDNSEKILFDSITKNEISLIVDSDLSLIANFRSKTIISDKAFENALVELGIDDVVDGFVNTQKCETITTLDLSDKGIENIQGIEAFKNLRILNLNNNYLENIVDFSSNNNLKHINLSNNINISCVKVWTNYNSNNVEIIVDNNINISTSC